jgi:hypothetical protein
VNRPRVAAATARQQARGYKAREREARYCGDQPSAAAFARRARYWRQVARMRAGRSR